MGWKKPGSPRVLANDGGTAEDDFVTLDTENVIGTASNDVIVGSDLANVITGGGGDDRIDGAGGDDTLRDGGGDNVHNVENVAGTDRTDFVQGDAGPNTIDTNGGVDSIQVLGGNDTIIGDTGRDLLEGGNGDDTFDGGLGADSQQGDSGFDTVQYGNRTLPVHLTLGDVNGDDGDATDGPAGARDTVRFIEHAITGEGDDVIEGSVVAEKLEPRGGRDTVRAGGGGDTLDTNDGIADDISCGEGPDPDPVDTLIADLADILDPLNQPRLEERESLTAFPVGEGPNVRIVTKRMRATRRARIRLHCPAAVTTNGCVGLLTLTHPGDGEQLAARRYGIDEGKTATVVLPLSRKDIRRLERSRRAIATATETGPSGRPKATRKEIPVVAR